MGKRRKAVHKINKILFDEKKFNAPQKQKPKKQKKNQNVST